MAMSIHLSAHTFSILALVNDPSLMAYLTPETARQARSNGHSQFLGWMSYIHLAWCLKTSLVFLYVRLTRNLDGLARPMIKLVVIIVGVTYVVSLFSILFHCYPLRKNWAIYPVPDKCITSIWNAWVICVT